MDDDIGPRLPACRARMLSGLDCYLPSVFVTAANALVAFGQPA